MSDAMDRISAPHAPQKCETEQMIQRAADFLAGTAYATQGSFGGSNVFGNGAQDSCLSTINAGRSPHPDPPADRPQDSCSFGFGSAAASSLTYDDVYNESGSASTKRLMRTDSHEKLSGMSSNRVNSENMFCCKGRRWGGKIKFKIFRCESAPVKADQLDFSGSFENLRRLTTGMSPSPSFENLGNLANDVGKQAVDSRIRSFVVDGGALNLSADRPRRTISQDNLRDCVPEETSGHQEICSMQRNSSIDNLLASGMLNPGEGAYQFLAHSIRYISNDYLKLDPN
jgi:hypothetical protein